MQHSFAVRQDTTSRELERGRTARVSRNVDHQPLLGRFLVVPYVGMYRIFTHWAKTLGYYIAQPHGSQLELYRLTKEWKLTFNFNR